MQNLGKDVYHLGDDVIVTIVFEVDGAEMDPTQWRIELLPHPAAVAAGIAASTITYPDSSITKISDGHFEWTFSSDYSNPDQAGDWWHFDIVSDGAVAKTVEHGRFRFVLGIANSTMTWDPLSVWPSNVEALYVATSDDLTSTQWTDRSGNGYHMGKVDEPSYPSFVADDWSSGLGTVQFDGVNHYLQSAPWVGDYGDCTLAIAVEILDTTSQQWLLTGQHITNVQSFWAIEELTSGEMGMQASVPTGWVTFAAPVLGQQVLIWINNAATAQRTLFRGGVLTGPVADYTGGVTRFGRNLAPTFGRTTLCAYHSDFAQKCQVNIRAFLFLDTVPTADEIASITTNLPLLT